MKPSPVLLTLLSFVLFLQEAGSTILRSRRASIATGTTPPWAVSDKKSAEDKTDTSSTSTTAAASPYTITDNTDDSTDDSTTDDTGDPATSKPAVSSKTAPPVQAVTVMISDANGTVSNFLTNATMVIATKNTTGTGSKGATKSSPAKTSDVKSSVTNTTGLNATGTNTIGTSMNTTNSTDTSGVKLDSAAPTQAPTNATHHLLPPEGEEPRHWPVVVASIFIILALALCIRTAWRQSKRRDYEVVESLVV